MNVEKAKRKAVNLAVGLHNDKTVSSSTKKQLQQTVILP